MTDDPIYLHYTKAELDRAYDQQAWAPGAADIIARYGTASRAARTCFPPLELRYGPGEAEIMDVYRPDTPGGGRPILVFVHGGAWRSLSRFEACGAVPAFVERGTIYVAVGFPTIPQARLPDMLEALRRAMLFLRQHAAGLGGDPARIVIAGHSSGAHLAAALLTTAWPALGGAEAMFQGGLCLSGSYDLVPVVLSARGTYLMLTPEEVEALSPLRHLDRLTCPLSVAWGTAESPEFIRHGEALAAEAAALGKLQEVRRLGGVNHFVMQELLADPASVPFAMASALLDRA